MVLPAILWSKIHFKFSKTLWYGRIRLFCCQNALGTFAGLVFEGKNVFFFITRQTASLWVFCLLILISWDTEIGILLWENRRRDVSSPRTQVMNGMQMVCKALSCKWHLFLLSVASGSTVCAMAVTYTRADSPSL